MASGKLVPQKEVQATGIKYGIRGGGGGYLVRMGTY